ncbi:hypothetical protein AB0O91_18995 [Kitasatospora sp. NPDC089797]|uniref:hypothetical protein n=1 Tax=Kitasatospora sp. NPDC089797 TaxID=3155298 RepID=UPI0034128B85
MNPDQQPDLDEIERWYADVPAGRDEADRWASRWYHDDDLAWDEPSLDALYLLCGIDSVHGPGEPYLYDDEQVREWLDGLRRRRARDGRGRARYSSSSSSYGGIVQRSTVPPSPVAARTTG